MRRCNHKAICLTVCPESSRHTPCAVAFPGVCGGTRRVPAPFRSRNNDLQNGIALCKNAHRLFDNGLLAIHEMDSSEHAAGHAVRTSLLPDSPQPP